MKNRKIKNNKGITLVALVVTIIVLLILAGVSLNTVFSQEGIFSRAESASEKYNVAKVRETLETIKYAYRMDKQENPDLTIDDFWKVLINAGVIESEGSVDGPEKDESGTKDIYTIETKDGYTVEIIVDKKGNIEIGDIDKSGKEIPKVKNIELTNISSNSVTVKVTVKNLQDGKLEYYYKKENEPEYKKLKTNEKELTAIYAGLEKGKVYNIKVIAKNKNGESELVVDASLEDLPNGVIAQKGEIEWNEGKATIEIETTQPIKDGIKIQYQINGTDENSWINYEGAIENIENGSKVNVRLYDGTNSSDVIHFDIEDKDSPTKPRANILSTANDGWYSGAVTINIIPGVDYESGVLKTTYTINNSAELDVQNNQITINQQGTTIIKLKTYDKVENSTESDSITIKIDSENPTVTAVNKSVNSGKTQATITGTGEDHGSKIVAYGWTESNAIPQGTTTSESEMGKWISVGETETITKSITIEYNAKIYFWVKDKAGNVSSERYTEVTEMDMILRGVKLNRTVNENSDGTNGYFKYEALVNDQKLEGATYTFYENGVLIYEGTNNICTGKIASQSEANGINYGCPEYLVTVVDSKGREGNRRYYYYMCLTKGTLVHTDSGLIPIERVTRDHKVYSYNEKENKVELKKVENTMKRTTDKLIKITLDNGEVFNCTEAHSWYIKNKGWIEAKEIKIGDIMITEDNKLYSISNIEILNQDTTVYNITVKDNHNYYVGQSKILTHNIACEGGYRNSGT